MMHSLLDTLKALIEKCGPANLFKATTALLVLLLLLQTARIGSVIFNEKTLTSSLKNVSAAPPQRNAEKKIDDFDTIFAKGAFGKGKTAPPPPKLFGVLGKQALMGTSPDDIKPYDIGAEIPGGAKIIRIDANQITLEKDGEESTLSVFPDFGKSPKKNNAPTKTENKNDEPKMDKDKNGKEPAKSIRSRNPKPPNNV